MFEGLIPKEKTVMSKGTTTFFGDSDNKKTILDRSDEQKSGSLRSGSGLFGSGTGSGSSSSYKPGSLFGKSDSKPSSLFANRKPPTLFGDDTDKSKTTTGSKYEGLFGGSSAYSAAVGGATGTSLGTSLFGGSRATGTSSGGNDALTGGSSATGADSSSASSGSCSAQASAFREKLFGRGASRVIQKNAESTAPDDVSAEAVAHGSDSVAGRQSFSTRLKASERRQGSRQGSAERRQDSAERRQDSAERRPSSAERNRQASAPGMSKERRFSNERNGRGASNERRVSNERRLSNEKRPRNSNERRPLSQERRLSGERRYSGEQKNNSFGPGGFGSDSGHNNVASSVTRVRERDGKLAAANAGIGSSGLGGSTQGRPNSSRKISSFEDWDSGFQN